MPLTITLWNLPVLDPFAEALAREGSPLRARVVRETPYGSLKALAQGAADISLVPVFPVLREPASYPLVPGLGLASLEAYPYVWLFIRGALDAVRRVAFDPRYTQEVLLARLILKEHYRAEASFVPYEQGRLAEAFGTEDAVLVVGSDAAADGPPEDYLAEDYLALDLGQEWYELTTRPMVWGVLATRLESLTGPDYAALKAAARRSGGPAGPLHAVLDESDLLGLEAFVNYLFYTNVLDEIPELRFVTVALDGENEVPQP